MSRVQLALRVADLETSVAFYSKLFDTEPAKRRPGYANFAIAEPPLKLVLLEGRAGQTTVLDHLGVEVFNTEEVTAATARLAEEGLSTRSEEGTTCCYAVQDKVWVRGPGGEPWEIYTVLADAPEGSRMKITDKTQADDFCGAGTCGSGEEPASGQMAVAGNCGCAS